MSVSTECSTCVQREVIKFWNLWGRGFIHLPVIVGCGRTSHFMSVSVAPKQRRIFVYDPRKRHDVRRWKWQIPSSNSTIILSGMRNIISKIMRGASAKSIQHIFNVASKLESNCNPTSYGIVWRIHMIKSFMCQENDVDCCICLLLS